LTISPSAPSGSAGLPQKLTLIQQVLRHGTSLRGSHLPVGEQELAARLASSYLTKN